MFVPLLSHLHVQRLGRGRPRTRLDRVLDDKAYSSRANGTLLRDRENQGHHRRSLRPGGDRMNRGRAVGRPPSFDAAAYKGRNMVDCWFHRIKD